MNREFSKLAATLSKLPQTSFNIGATIATPQKQLTPNIDTSKIDDGSKTVAMRFKDIVSAAKENLSGNNIFTMLETEQGRLMVEAVRVNDKIKAISDNYKKFLDTLKTPAARLAATEQIEEFDTALSKVHAQADKLTQRFNKLQTPKLQTTGLPKITAEMDNAGKAAAKSASRFDKLAASFKRIFFYRAVRTVIREISQAFQEGIQNYAQYSEIANATMSNLMNTGNQLKNTLGVTFASVLQALEPLITTLADGVINIVNGINAAMSAMQGATVFDKAKKGADSYADSLKKVNGQLFSFDKFETLSVKKQENLYESTPINEMGVAWAALGETLAKVKALFAGVLEASKPLFDAVKSLVENVLPNILKVLNPIIDACKWIINNIAAPLIKFVAEATSKLFEWANSSGVLEAALWGLAGVMTIVAITKIPALIAAATKFVITTIPKVLGALASWIAANWGLVASFGALTAAVFIFQQWDTFSEKTRAAITVLSSLVAVLSAAAVAALAMKGALTMGAAVPLIVTAVAAGAVAIKGIMSSAQSQTNNLKAYAEGGYPQRGELFIANEAGAELVGNIGGRTAVANNDMIVSAIRQAAYEGIVAGLGQSDFGKGSGEAVFNLDGRTFARAIYPQIKAEQRRVGDK